MADLTRLPGVVLVISGKRKSGKDFVANKLRDLFGHDICEIIRLSGPLKYEYARLNHLDFNRLLDSSSYKETHRQDMIRWGEEKRKADPCYFCKLAVQSLRKPLKPIWLVSDARRKTDLFFFKKAYDTVLTVRIDASETTRRIRGWVFTPGVDDAESECGLDREKFDIVIQNDGNEGEFDDCIKKLQIRVSELLIDSDRLSC